MRLLTRFDWFVSVLRTYAAFLAGASGMSWRGFDTDNAASRIIQEALCAGGAYALRSIDTGLGTMSTYLGIGLAALLSDVFAVLVHRAMPKWEPRVRASEAAPNNPLGAGHQVPRS